MKIWARFLKKARDESVVAADNHYPGFGPETANAFRKMLDLSEVTWKLC